MKEHPFGVLFYVYFLGALGVFFRGRLNSRSPVRR